MPNDLAFSGAIANALPQGGGHALNAALISALNHKIGLAQASGSTDETILTSILDDYGSIIAAILINQAVTRLQAHISAVDSTPTIKNARIQ